jgi:prophage regulatory protein
MLKTNNGNIIGGRNEPNGPQKIIRRHDLKDVTGYSVGHIYALIEAGSFPKPIPLGPRAVGWLASEIDTWQRERVKERDAREAA